MPRRKRSDFEKVRSYAQEFTKLKQEKTTLICTVCEKTVNYDIRSHVTQHLASEEHKKNAEKAQNNPRQTFISSEAFTAPSTSNNQFTMDLCNALISANIPFYKLSNATFKSFLFKYTKENIPDRTTIAKNYLPEIYKAKFLKLRNKLNKQKLWVSIDDNDTCYMRMPWPTPSS